MPKFEAHQLPAYQSDIVLQRAVQQYKSYCTIRRDLRNADAICNYVIDIHKKIISREIKLDDIVNSIFLIRSSAMHAITLYGRWFKATDGKPMLKPETFFTPNSDQMAVHARLINHRDRYIAHNELDLLGADRVWINIDDDNKFVSSESDWYEQMWLQDNELNMTSFRDCVHVVHDKIDAEILPDRKRKLDGRLITLLGAT